MWQKRVGTRVVGAVAAAGSSCAGRRRRNRRRAGVRAVAAVGIVCSLAAGCDGDSPAGLPPPSLPELFGDELYRADGSVVGLEVFDGVPVIGIYFGAGSCSACAPFTPLLVDAYHLLEEDGRPFEVVYVSSDASEAAMFSYMQDSGMPWVAVPWRGAKARALVDRYGVRWIPTLVVVDGAGKTISLDGRDELYDKGAAAYDDWLAASTAP